MTTENSGSRSGSDVETTSGSGIRPVIRAASTTTSPSTSVNGSLREPNDGAHTGTTHRRRSRTTGPVRDITSLASQLSDRDWSILRSVAEHRYLAVPQIQALHFGDLPPASGLRTTQRVLARLRRYRVLASLTQRIGGMRSGSSGLVHYVDVVGDRLLRLEAGRGPRRRFEQPTQRFLDHQLGIAEAHVALVKANRQGQLELVRCETEPTAWRDYVGVGGTRLTLKPDLYAETACPPGSEYVDAAFIEIDKGTESIPTLLKKCREYEAYRRCGTEQEQSGGAFPFVVWSMSADTEAKAERRCAALRDAIDGDRRLPVHLFRVIAPDQLISVLQKGGEV
ncbi:replication-relaxation family protein [Nocardia sp. NPDC051929]|uniref:replication-relaxation family protein n=1 Tax=Nocardia sp. NPDC051929 TaxID=3364327 RepID=UPI0037C80297